MNNDDIEKAMNFVFDTSPEEIRPGTSLDAFEAVRIYTAELESGEVAIIMQTITGEAVTYVMSREKAHQYGRELIEFVNQLYEEES